MSMYLAKYTSLSDLGLYGLVSGGTVIATAAFGARIDYPLMRDLPAMSKSSASLGTNGAAHWLALNYALPAAPLLWMITCSAGNASLALSLTIYALFCLESFANFLYNITVILNRAQLANNLFFLRSGAWVVPAIGIGVLLPSLRGARCAILCWLIGVGLAIVINIWALRDRIRWDFLRPSNMATETKWVCSALRRSFGIWIGTLALMAGGSTDRFILAHYCTLSDVGVATFYLSFTSSMATLVQSATFVPMQARLIALHDSQRGKEFSSLVRKGIRDSIFVALSLAVPIGVVVRLAGFYAGKSELYSAGGLFWLILTAGLIRSVVEGLYYPLFVLRLDRSVWIGNLIFCSATVFGNLVLIPKFGLTGLGVSALLASLTLTAVRIVPLRRPFSADKVPVYRERRN